MLKKSYAAPGPMGGHGRRPAEKPRDFSGTWGRLIRYCRAYLPAVGVALTLAVAGTVFSLIGPRKLQQLTDLITEGMMAGIDLAAVQRIGILLVVLYGLGALFTYIQGFIMATVTQRLTRRLRTAISEKINRLPLRYFDRTSFGDVLSRVTNDVDTIGQTMNQSIGTLVTAVTMLLGSLVMMLTLNVLMTLAAVAASLLGFAAMLLIIRKSQSYFFAQQQELGSINGHIEEIYTGHDVVKAYNGEQQARERFGKINQDLYDSAWRSQFLSGLMMPLMNFVGNLGYVAVCVVGAVLTMRESISFGVIVAFMIYVRLFTQPLSQLAQAATNLQSTAAASERVFEFLAEEELADESEKTAVLPTARGDVTFSHVSFGYTPDKLIIHDFSAEAKAGQKVAIVGPTGAGKTTIVNLLMRFYEVDSGEIRIDGVPIQSLRRENVHDLFYTYIY